jgi:hypothetical protein
MTDYGKGAILGATTLPATSALGIALVDKLHPVMVVAFFAINLLMFVILISHISRFFVNNRAK